MVGSGRERIGDSLKHSEGSKGPIGNGREWSGAVGSVPAKELGFRELLGEWFPAAPDRLATTR